MNATGQAELERIEEKLNRNLELQHDDCEWLISQLKAAQNQWQPIATAPKNKRVLLYSPTKGIVRGYWWSGNLD